MKNAIVLILDDLFIIHAKACINSIKQNYNDHPIIVVYYDGDNEEFIEYLNSIGNLIVHVLNNNCFGLIGLDVKAVDLGVVNNLKVYYKYLLWTSIFDEYDKILYLDADTLVLNSLEELFTQDDFFAVTDYSESDDYKLFRREFVNCDTLRSILDQDGLHYPKGVHDMINAGVFLIPKVYRTEFHLRELIAVTYKYSKYMTFADQSAISIWCHKNGIKIQRNYYYNFQVSFYTKILQNFLHDKIRIIHFSWCKPGTHSFQYLRESFNHFVLVDNQFLELKA